MNLLEVLCCQKLPLQFWSQLPLQSGHSPLVSSHPQKWFPWCQSTSGPCSFPTNTTETDACFVFYCDYVATNTKVLCCCYLSANLNSWSVSFHNKTGESFGGWAFRICIGACKEEIPKTLAGKKKKKKSHKQTTRGQINKNHNSCLMIQFNVVLLCLTRLNSLQGSVLVRQHWIRTGYEQI